MNRTAVNSLGIGACLLCSGCGRAPAIDVIGSFFPVWMVCLIISIVLTSLLRVFLLRRQLEPVVEPAALFYPSVVLLLSCLLWLIFFR
ncbi:YtcA family lipoprotein [Edaphobacter aggregans]|uniref:YtcA family lipoprotein n=1 Tax=Edaphobacter aggregans TaxID=570835 RepID=UPI000554DE9E|nr:YtcA family lipoprotein [Edaphobacter aggregans]